MKKLVLFFTFTLSLFGIEKSFIDSLPTGWHNLGSSSEITDFSIFENSYIVWRWENEKWYAHSEIPLVSKKVSEAGYEKFDTLQSFEGFWILKDVAPFGTGETSSGAEISEEPIKTLPKGWHNLGSSSEITDFSIFKVAEIVWAFKDGEWKAFSPNSEKSLIIRNQGITLSQIDKNQAFWISVSGNPIIEDVSLTSTVREVNFSISFYSGIDVNFSISSNGKTLYSGVEASGSFVPEFEEYNLSLCVENAYGKSCKDVELTIGETTISTPPEVGEIVENGEITDAYFLKCINYTLGKSATYSPTKEELEGITSLDCNGIDREQNISNISGVGNLSNLTYLDLYLNQISEIPSEIGNLSNLTYLDLCDNQISEIPSEIGNLPNLQKLYLGDNQISEIPNEIGNLSNLQTLYLGGNQISEIGSGIGNLSNLQTLYLGGNQISEIGSGIGNLSNLKYLSLGDNQISEIGSEIGNLSNLTALYLHLNQISEIPSWIGNLYNLQRLSLYSNQISEIPSEIGNLSNLTYLSLSGNNITEIPSALNSLSNLSESHNGSSWIDKSSSETVVEFLERVLGL
jgi:Leucine-rich repeat (LRR) protein